jgi:hypothetical protein
LEVIRKYRTFVKRNQIMDEIKDKILEEYKKGNVVIAGIDGLGVAKLDDLIKQPTEGLLYDLNRDEMTILTFLPDRKWVNDYASTQVIRALKNKIEEVEDKTGNYGWTKAEMRSMLEDVVSVLDLSDYMLEKHGPIGTSPAELVRLVLEQKDREIKMLQANLKKIEQA